MHDRSPSSSRGRPAPDDVARSAGLRYVTDSAPGITRRRCGRGWTYRDPEGRTIRSRAVRRRIEALAIPPAWTDVWICPDPEGHLQATGRDARGRKQYRYHPRFREARDTSKFSRLVMFGLSLPRIRARIEADLETDGLPLTKTLAAAVRILDAAPIRVGNDRYARANRSFGLTTMREHHVEIEEDLVHFRFRGKSGKEQRVGIADARLAEVLRECCEVPGREVLMYVDEDGDRERITSDDVNEYLREVSGYDFTAKDFRTWAGTVRTVTVLHELGPAPDERERKAKAVQAVKFVAADLGNTPATCRAYYIHPAVLEAYEEGRLLPLLDEILDADAPERASGLREEEWPVMVLLPRLEALALREGAAVDEDLERMLRSSLDVDVGSEETPAP